MRRILPDAFSQISISPYAGNGVYNHDLSTSARRQGETGRSWKYKVPSKLGLLASLRLSKRAAQKDSTQS